MTSAKFITALTAALGVAASVAADSSLPPADWVAILTAFVGALGVYVIPNRQRK